MQRRKKRPPRVTEGRSFMGIDEDSAPMSGKDVLKNPFQRRDKTVRQAAIVVTIHG